MCDVASLVITALVVHSLGSYKMKLKMMQYMGTREAGQAAAPFNHYERTAQEADLSFLYPAHFNHYTMFCRRGSIRSYKASWSPPGLPTVTLNVLFSSSSSWNFRLKKEVAS